jgi:mycofactocin precursor peptide peptidase
VNRLETMSWPDVSRRSVAGAILLIPCGSTEQHGPHLPVTTDTDIAVAVSVGAALRHSRLVVAPPLAYGSSGEHQGFAGTLSIGQDATESLLVELGRSASIDFAHVIVVSAHGGNAVPLSRAVTHLQAEGHPVTAWSPPWSGDLHAGRTETSLMLAIDPTRVQLDLAEAGDLRSVEELWPLLRQQGTLAVSPNGVLGDPAGAHADEGRRLLALAVDQLTDVADGLSDVSTREVTGWNG